MITGTPSIDVAHTMPPPHTNNRILYAIRPALFLKYTTDLAIFGTVCTVLDCCTRRIEEGYM